MNLNESALKELNYDRTKIVVSFLPVVVSGRLTFKMSDSVNRSYAFKDAGNGFVIPCFKTKTEVSKSVFADVFVYEQTRVPGDYGTYSIVPNAISAGKLNSFMQIPGRYPVFAGYFDNLYAANRAYSEFVLPTMLNRILPFERISDPRLVEEMKNKDFTEYSYDDAGGDDAGDTEDDDI